MQKSILFSFVVLTICIIPVLKGMEYGSQRIKKKYHLTHAVVNADTPTSPDSKKAVAHYPLYFAKKRKKIDADSDAANQEVIPDRPRVEGDVTNSPINVVEVAVTFTKHLVIPPHKKSKAVKRLFDATDPETNNNVNVMENN